MNWLMFLAASIQLFAITDPVGNLPIFHSLTKKLTPEEREKTFLTAVLFAFSLLIVFAFLGNAILALFKITIADLKVAGGIMILIIAILILVRGSWVEDGSEHQHVGAVPLACPLLVGPGAITTAMVSINTNGIYITLLAIAINFVVALLILRYGDRILRFLGENGTDIISRVMAILLAAIAVSFIHSGFLIWFAEFPK